MGSGEAAANGEDACDASSDKLLHISGRSRRADQQARVYLAGHAVRSSCSAGSARCLQLLQHRRVHVHPTVTRPASSAPTRTLTLSLPHGMTLA